MTTFYLAICGECDQVLPFYDEQERNDWVIKHEQGMKEFWNEVHRVVKKVEVR